MGSNWRELELDFIERLNKYDEETWLDVIQFYKDEVI